MRCNQRDREGFGLCPGSPSARAHSVTAAAALFGRRTGAGMASEVKAGQRGRRRTQNDLESVQTAALSERSGDSSTILPRQQPEPPNVPSPSSATTSPRHGRRQFIPRHAHSPSDQSATEKLVLEAGQIGTMVEAMSLSPRRPRPSDEWKDPHHSGSSTVVLSPASTNASASPAAGSDKGSPRWRSLAERGSPPSPTPRTRRSSQLRLVRDRSVPPEACDGEDAFSRFLDDSLELPRAQRSEHTASPILFDNLGATETEAAPMQPPRQGRRAAPRRASADDVLDRRLVIEHHRRWQSPVVESMLESSKVGEGPSVLGMGASLNASASTHSPGLHSKDENTLPPLSGRTRGISEYSALRSPQAVA